MFVKLSLARLIITLTALGFIHCLPTSNATLLHDGSIPLGGLNNLGYNDTGTPQRLAEDFTFTSPVIANRISFLGGYYPSSTPPLSDSFTLTIYNSLLSPPNLPNPSSVVAQIGLGNFGRTPTGVTLFGSQIFSYTTTFSGVPLAAGERYWLSIVNDTTADANDNWVWAGNNNGVLGLSGDSGATWFAVTGKMSFSLEGVVVPEPASGALLGSGLLSLFLSRRRRQAED